MNKVFEKIIEKLEKEKMYYFLTIANTGDEKLDYAYEKVGNALDKSIEIVKQVAEQYNNAIIDGKYCFQSCACTEKCDKCSRLCNGDIDWYENIDNWTEYYNNGWIPCSERLPNQDGEFTDVLVTCESMADGVFVQSAEFYIASDGEPVFDALYHYERVLAWQQLLPYQPKGE